MPNLSRSGSALIMPSGYNTQDLEQSKFSVNNGTASVNVTQVGGASGYSEGTTVGTITGNAIIFRGTAGTTVAVGTQYPLPVQEEFGPQYEDNTNGVAAILQKPVSSITYSPSEFTSFGQVAGTVVKTQAGNVYACDVTSGTTAIRYFQLHNGTVTPSLGGTPIASYPLGSVSAGGIYRLPLDTTHFAPSKYFSSGIAWAISSTNGTLGTASVTAGDYNVHIKYV